METVIGFDDAAMVSVKRNDYITRFCYMSKNEAINQNHNF